MTFETLAHSHPLPMRTLRVWVDRTLFVVAVLTIIATTLAVHPGATRAVFPVVTAGER